VTKSESYRKVYKRRRFWLKARINKQYNQAVATSSEFPEIQSASVSDKSTLYSEV